MIQIRWKIYNKIHTSLISSTAVRRVTWGVSDAAVILCFACVKCRPDIPPTHVMTQPSVKSCLNVCECKASWRLIRYLIKVYGCVLKGGMSVFSLCRLLNTHQRVTQVVITDMRRCERAAMALRRVRWCADQTVLTTSTQRAVHTAELNPHISTGPETGMEV